MRWFRGVGFTDIKKCHIAPQWIRGEKYGIAIAGTKPQPGTAEIAFDPTIAEEATAPMTLSRSGILLSRLLVGSAAGFLFMLVAIWGRLRQTLLHSGGLSKK